MAKSAVEIFLLLRDVRKFVEQANQASKAVTGIGHAAEKSGKRAGVGWKGIAKWGGGAAVIYGATRYIKGATSETVSLAKSTLQLQRVTGMDTQTSSEWVGVLKQRHVSAEMFGRTLAQLSKQMETARTGTNTQTSTMRKLRREYEAVSLVGGKKAPAALTKIQHAMDAARRKGDTARTTFATLGVSMDAIRKGDTQEVIAQIADRFKTMTNPAQRAALAQKLFGRSAQRLLPILIGGRKAIEENLDLQKRYGNYLSGKSLADTRKLIHQQHEMDAAFSGLKVQLGTALMPAIIGVVGAIVKLTRVLQPLLRNRTVMLSLLGALVTLWMAYKVAVVAATIAQLGLDAATWGWIGLGVLIVAALVAIGYGVYKLYKRWGWFHNAVDAAWRAIKVGAAAAWGVLKAVLNWVVHNWQYVLVGALTGPFGLATLYIVKHFDKIKSAIGEAVSWIKTKFNELVSFVADLPKRLGGGVLGKLSSIASKVGGIAKHIPGASLFGGAAGGVNPRRGPVLVGEAGPELLHLPQGAMVQPLPQPPSFASTGAWGDVVVPVTVTLDRRVVGQAVARYGADKLARR